MEQNNCKENQWKIYGRFSDESLKPDFKKSDIEYGDVLIEEQVSDLDMKPRKIKPTDPESGSGSTWPTSNPEEKPKDSFGLPITADLAIRLIAEAHDSSSAAKGFVHGLYGFNKSPDFIQNVGFLKDLIGFNYGVTFDKTILLKILGQPNCEGLRYYLCKRPDAYLDSNMEEDSHLSLVLVGVDSEGFDLNYDENAVIEQEKKLDNKSLIGEYGYPPTSRSFQFKEHDPHYILLNHARKILVDRNPLKKI